MTLKELLQAAEPDNTVEIRSMSDLEFIVMIHSPCLKVYQNQPYLVTLSEYTQQKTVT